MLKRDRAPLLSRREMLEKSGLGFGGLTLDGLLSGQSVLANGRRPNVLLILSDDQGFGDIGINGNTILKTPNLDRLAREGVAFRRFYVDPICAPSRASLLTGRYHQRVGVPYADGPTDVLRLREVTIAKALRREGYATAIIGKWHLGRFGAYGPLAHGFDQFLGFRDGMIAFYNDGVLEYNGEPVRSNGHVTDVFTEAAIRFMEDNRSRPFFLYLAYNAPHLPMTVPIRYEEPYRKLGVSSHLAKFYGMVTHLDESIGRVLQRLEELGLNNDTIVVFLSDNGMQKSHVQFNVSAESDRLDALWIGVDRFNAGLRSQKGTVYEGGIRVPFIARWPGRFPEGKTLNTPAAHIDIMPTLLELTNAKVPDRVKFDGKSLAGILRSGEDRSLHDKLFIWCEPGVRKGSRIEYPKSNYAVLSGRWKLVSGAELFDLEKDPTERRNVIDQYPQIARDLRTAFEVWSEDVIPQEDLTVLPVPIDGENTPALGSNIVEGGTNVSLRWAELHGGLRFAYDKNIRDRITNWRFPGDYLSWDVDIRKEGRYDVILQYGCSAADAGSRIQIRTEDVSLEGVVQATPGIDVWKNWTVGSLTLTRGTRRLEIRPLEVRGRSVIDLHEVRLLWTGGL